MKSKNIKVAYTSRYNQKTPCTVPQLKMEGKWLEDIGFSIGSTVIVEYEKNTIRIRPLTAEELTLKEQQELQFHLKQKEKELRSMQASYEHLSKVAESANAYHASPVKQST